VAKVIKARTRPRVVDLYAGAGGLSLGFEQAGFDVVAVVEFDPIHCATHEFNFPKTSVICADTRTVTGDNILEVIGLKKGELDVLVGGPPCQGFSLMGKRALDDPRNELVSEFGRLVLELNPKYFVMENVAGLTQGNHKQFLGEIIEFFRDAGYEIKTPYKVLDAGNFGVPQHRERLFLIGARKGFELPDYPEPKTISRKMRPKENWADELPIIDVGPSVLDALGDLPNVDDLPELALHDSAVVSLGNPSAYASKLRGETVDLDDHAHKRVWDESILTSSARTVHTQKTIERFRETPHGFNEEISRFLKLHPEGISNTLRAGTNSDRGAHTAPRPIHPIHNRVITVREAARLHSYPDWFRFHVSKWHGFRQIGNSVPPLLGRAVAEEIFKVLNGKHFEVDTLTLGDPSLLMLTPASAAEKYKVTRMISARRNRGISKIE
jgi:DNA (cytosine-5)-methyltransferase 1